MDRHSCRVAKAASPSADPSAPRRPPQKRRREVRTYQLLRSSRKASSARPAPVASKASRRSVTSAVVPSRRDRIQRSTGRSAAGSGAGPPGRPAVGQRGVGDEERVGVPERQQEAPHRVVDRLEAEAEGVPGALGGEQVPAEGVGALAVEDDPGLDHVALALAHLLALAVEDQPEADHVAVGRLVEQERALGEQRVEPAARLVERLADEVGGHAPGQVAARRRTGGAPARRAWRRCRTRRPRPRARGASGPPQRAGELHLVHERAVGVEVGTERRRGALAQVGVRADGVDPVAVAAAPQRQRRAPVAVARDRPVDVALEPLAEAPVAHPLGVPADAAR